MVASWKRFYSAIASVVAFLWAVPLQPAASASTLVPVSTFSIVAIDPQTGDLGVAVASRYFAVGSVVPWAEAGVGVVATQANVNIAYGPVALTLLKEGFSASQVLAQLLEQDSFPGKDGRQVAIIDAAGRIASFTGTAAPSWAGHLKGSTWSVQGNLLRGPEVIQAMHESFANSSGELAEKLYAALRAGDEAGGDKRGRQSASFFVVGSKRERNLNNDRYVYLHVDDHVRPFDELRRLLDLNLAYHYQSEAWKLIEAGKLEEGAKRLAKAAPYCSSTDTHLRQGFLSYLAGKKELALSEFHGVKSAPDFQQLWNALLEVWPAFAAVQGDQEFLGKLANERP